jgi:hypothetical protein
VLLAQPLTFLITHLQQQLDTDAFCVLLKLSKGLVLLLAGIAATPRVTVVTANVTDTWYI